MLIIIFIIISSSSRRNSSSSVRIIWEPWPKVRFSHSWIGLTLRCTNRISIYEIQILISWPYEQMVYAQPNICPGECHTQTPLGFWHTNRLSNPGHTTWPYNNQEKKRTCKIVDYDVPDDYRVKLKESEKKAKYLNLARELKKLWNMKVTFILIVIDALGRVTKGLKRDWRTWK